MTLLEAQTIVNSQQHVEAVLFYRRKPIETSDETFRLARLWIDAAFILSNINPET